MKKKRGFTLIEVLGVIIILTILFLITVPVVLYVIQRADRASYKESLRNIFSATDIYIAGNQFDVFPDEGIYVIDQTIQMKNKKFTGGKIVKNEFGVLELDRVSNQRYCAKGTFDNLIIVDGSCNKLDTTPPNVSITSNLITSSSVTIVATAYDLESGISHYEFSKDNGVNWTSGQQSNVYKFTELTNNTNYTFKVRVYNNNELFTVSDEITVRTVDIPTPTYSINTTDWSDSVVVTIHYPERQIDHTYEYSLDNAVTWILVEEPTITSELVFNTNGSVIARITDGTNVITGVSYSVANVDIYKPDIVFNIIGNPFNENGWANTNSNVLVSAEDLESGILNFKYCQTTIESCVPSNTINHASTNLTISTESATNKICAEAFDMVGNSSGVICSSNYKIDKTAPIAGNIILTGTEGLNGWYTTDVNLSKSDGSDLLSGHANTTLSHSILSTSGTVTLTTIDNAGNITTKNQPVKIDKTAPTSLNLTSGTITTDSISLTASGQDLESGITHYAFSKDNGVNWTNYQSGNSYTFTNLTSGTYQLKVRIRNGAGLTADSESISRTTVSLPTPTYSISPSGWATSKTVTINYQTSGYTKQYSTNGGSTWVTSSGQTQNVVFNTNGNVIARVTDGTNIITASTYNITQIDTTAPTPPTIAKSLHNFTIASGTDSGSGVYRSTYVLSGATTVGETQYTGAVTISNIGTTTITAYTYDNVGNRSSSTTTMVVASSICSSGWYKSGTSCETSQSASSSYYCSSGWSLSGSTCYQSQSASSSYYCSSGWSLSGSTCYQSQSASASYYCPSGWTLSGTTCSRQTTYTIYSRFDATYVCSSLKWAFHSHTCSGNCNAACADGNQPYGSYEYYSSCPSSGTSCSPSGSSTSCSTYWTGTCRNPVETQSASVSYSCPSGWSLSGSTCTRSQSAYVSYSCPSGWSLSGSTCTRSQSAYISYSCSSGWSLSGSTCYTWTTPHCSSGSYSSTTDRCY
jgi:prepilin-type N-terminal cleavage/methylation domain-containing protein